MGFCQVAEGVQTFFLCVARGDDDLQDLGFGDALRLRRSFRNVGEQLDLVRQQLRSALFLHVQFAFQQDNVVHFQAVPALFVGLGKHHDFQGIVQVFHRQERHVGALFRHQVLLGGDDAGDGHRHAVPDGVVLLVVQPSGIHVRQLHDAGLYVV